MKVYLCPEPGCGAPATVEYRVTFRSADGPFTLAKINCLARHWYTIPASRLMESL